MARAAHTLERRGDVSGRLELHDQVDRADVDPELEGRRGDERPELALLEAILGLEPGPAGERAVVGRDAAVGDAVVQITRDPLRRPPALSEDEIGRASCRGRV